MAAVHKSALLMVLGEGESFCIEVPPGAKHHQVQITMMEKTSSGSGRRAKLRVVAELDVKLHRPSKDAAAKT